MSSAPQYQPRRSSTGKKVGIGCLGVLVVLALMGGCIAALGGGAMQATPPGAVATPSDPGGGASAAPSSTGSASKAPGKPVLTDGTWTAGEDVPVGKWKSRGVPTDELIPGCSWSTSRNGQPIDGGFTEAGRPTLRLKKGDEVLIAGCGTWDLVPK